MPSLAEFRAPKLKESLSPKPLTQALVEVYGHYKLGQYSPRAVERVNSLIDIAAQESEHRGYTNPLKTFNPRVQHEASKFPFQQGDDRFFLDASFPLNKALRDFERRDIKAPLVLRSVVREFLGNRTGFNAARYRDLGFFYLYLSGIMTNGDVVPQHGFLAEDPTMDDMLRSDYLYHRGLKFLKFSMDIEAQARDSKVTEVFFAGTKARKRAAEYQARASVPVASRPFVHAHWQSFVDSEGSHFRRGERRLAQAITESYKAQIDADIANGSMPGLVFSDKSPVAVFTGWPA